MLLHGSPLMLGGFALLGAVLGTVGTIIGAGGGFLLVPVLLLLHWPHTEAVGTSLVMVTANALSGSISYLRQRLVDLATGWRLALSTLPGAALGSLVVSHLSGRIFNLMFGLFLLCLGMYVFFSPRRRMQGEGAALPPRRPAGLLGLGYVLRDFQDRRGRRFTYGYSLPVLVLLSFGVGFLSSTLGIGGGIIHVPALIGLFHFPAHVATATSHFILFFSAATGAGTDLYLHHVRILPGVVLAAGAIVGAQVGGALSHRIKGPWILRALGLALVLVGVRLLIHGVFTPGPDLVYGHP